LGDGDGSFQAPSPISLGNSSGTFVATGDFNGDGKADLVVATFVDIKVLLGNGDGTFAPPVTYLAGTEPIAIAVGDLNADGCSSDL
jgi:FG-GAP-like repeat